MPSTQTLTEYNGAGATPTTGRGESNWKRVDDSSTAYGSSPINATNNENSMPKIQAPLFGGTYAMLSSLTVKIDNNAPATGLSIVGSVLTSYTQPATTATGDSAFSTSGLSMNFVSASTPFGAGTASYSTAGGVYGNAVRSQLQTLNTYAGGPGDISQRTFTYQWIES